MASVSVATKAPILISGSGLAGLLVARALATHDIPFLVYERDETAVNRAQGYRLRMSVEGLAAMERILPPDAWKSLRAGIATTIGHGVQRINAITGEPEEPEYQDPKDDESASPKDAAPEPPQPIGPVMSGRGPNGEIYGAARGHLRSELLKTLDGKVHFGKRVVGFTSTSEGVTAHFEDGTNSPQGSLLIGADGIHSRVTKQVSKGAVRWYDTQTRMIHGQTTTRAFRKLGEGVYALSDTSRPGDTLVRVICNVRPGDVDDDEQTFGWTMVGSPGVIDAPDGRFQVVGKTAADLARSLTVNWSDRVRAIFTDQVEEEAGFWKMTTTSPDGVPEWPNDPRVTVVGDAVHSMTPAGGNGANTALQTAAILGELLREGGGWYDGVTKAFEEKMRVLASANVKASVQTARHMFGIGELVEDTYDPSVRGPTS